jgi:hypothetical protein
MAIGTVTLTRSALATSRLGFGTSRLHHMPARARADILALAVDLGLRHIDTAPAYGDGLAERLVGDVFRGRRDSIVLATKAGLPPYPLADRFPALSGAARAWRLAKRAAGVPQQWREPITPAGIRSSVEASLRRLRVDHVDVLFLHEPSPRVIADPDGVLQALLAARRDGLARHVGLAGGWGGIAALGRGFLSEPLLIQTHEDQWPEDHRPDITYGALSSGPQAFGARVRITPANAKERLLRAISRRSKQAVLVATTDAEHLRALAAAVLDAP